MSSNTFSLPAQSLLNTNSGYDYVDSYSAELNDPNNTITSQDVGKAFFTSAPGWVEKLFTFRNKVVALFGLKVPNGNRQEQLKHFKCEPGEQLGLFKVFARTENEVIIGEDDKHLDFRVSLLLSPQQNDSSKRNLTISTTVKFHNRMGRLYFFPVKPFHRVVVPAMMKRITPQLERSIK